MTVVNKPIAKVSKVFIFILVKKQFIFNFYLFAYIIKLKMDQHLVAYYIGIAIVFLSHGYNIVEPTKPLFSMQIHNWLNLAAAFLIAYYFLFQEKYITY